MADVNEIGSGFFISKGIIRELYDGSLYIVTENGTPETLKNICICAECRSSYKRQSDTGSDEYWCINEKWINRLMPGTQVQYDGFCMFGAKEDKVSWDTEKAANDLERYLLRGEPPAKEAVAIAIESLRRKENSCEGCRYKGDTWYMCYDCTHLNYNDLYELQD